MTNPTRSLITAGLLLIGVGAGWVLARTVGPGEATATPKSPTATTHGEWVGFPNSEGDTVRAYVAWPERADPAPAVIVIHEIFGMTEWEPTVADQYAVRGYLAIERVRLEERLDVERPTVTPGSVAPES